MQITRFLSMGALFLIIGCTLIETSVPCVTADARKFDYNTLAINIDKIRIKSNDIMKRKIEFKKYLAKECDNLNHLFDPKILLNEFPQLRLKKEITLQFGFTGSPFADGHGFVFVVDNGEKHLLRDVYKEYIEFNKCKEGYFQYVLFWEELDLLTLSWHAFYDISWFIPSRQAFEKICSHGEWESFVPSFPPKEERDFKFWRSFKFSFRSFTPKVIVEGKYARIKYYRFYPWGGIYQVEYLLNIENGIIEPLAGQDSSKGVQKEDYIIRFMSQVMI